MKIARVSRTASSLATSRALRLSCDAASVALALALALVGCGVADDGGGARLLGLLLQRR